LKGAFSWVNTFLQKSALIDRMIDHEFFSAEVGPWLSRMNDETLPAGIRQKLCDFDTALTEKDELETTATTWRDAQRPRLPDMYLEEWTANLEHSPQEPNDAAAKDV
jgi:hypothetical protein